MQPQIYFIRNIVLNWFIVQINDVNEPNFSFQMENMKI